MRRALLTLLMLLMGMTAAVRPTHAPAAQCKRVFGSGKASSCTGKLAWRYDPSSKAFVRDAAADVDWRHVRSGPKYDWVRQERCGPRDATCAAATSTCRRSSLRGYRYLVFGFVLNS